MCMNYALNIPYSGIQKASADYESAPVFIVYSFITFFIIITNNSISGK